MPAPNVVMVTTVGETANTLAQHRIVWIVTPNTCEELGRYIPN